MIQLAVFTSEGNRLRFYHRVIGNNQIDPTHRSSIIIRKSTDKKLSHLVCCGQLKLRQEEEDPGNQLKFQFDLRKLFISVFLSSTLVTFLTTVVDLKMYFMASY